MRRGRRHDAACCGRWLVEIAIFSLIAERFFTVGNLFEVLRLSVELGLLAIALTPILISGGIDLSVGSMMGLSAVVFGAAARDWGCRCRWRRCWRSRRASRAARSTAC